MKFFGIICYVLCFCALVGCRQLPEYVLTCKRNDPNIDKCIASSIQKLVPYLVDGIPEMGIPPIDPLNIPALTLANGNGNNVGYKIELTDLVFKGGKAMKVLKADGNFSKQTFKMKVSFPEFLVSGKYKSTGKALLIELQGDGDVTGTFTNIDIDGTWEATKYTKKGKDYFKFYKSDVIINIGKMQTYFSDLFKGNEELTNNTNRIFNENSDLLYNDIKPVVGEGMSKLMTSVLNEVHKRYSIDDLYP